MWKESWPSIRQMQLDKDLTSLEELVNIQSPSEPTSAELSRFLVIRTCGYLEQSVEVSCCAYLKSKSSPRCASFGKSWFGTGANPRPGSLQKIVERFDISWGKDLEIFFKEDDEFLKREINFLVDTRNKISHGVSQGVNQRKALDLVPVARKTAQWFIEKFDPR